MEYNNQIVSGSNCSYANLNNYNGAFQGLRPPVPATTVTGKYIVPIYGTLGYNALTHGDQPSCVGYFNINQAYGGLRGGNCNTEYAYRLCQ
jgi:hypothetical protein